MRDARRPSVRATRDARRPALARCATPGDQAFARCATPGDSVTLNVIMMGPPGAGKGTQSGRFARERGLSKVSTGDILREGAKMGLPVALRAKERMDRGELVDDDTMIAIVRERLEQPDAQPGFVLDGFPRT